MLVNYQELFKSLEAAAIDYLVVGGLAVNFHGIPRLTYDVDFMIELGTGNVLKLVELLSEWGYKPRIPVRFEDLANQEIRRDWIREKNLKAFSVFSDVHPIREIDILVDSPLPYEALKKRCLTIQLEEVSVPVISLDDLITLKRVTGRLQDQSDVAMLEKLRNLNDRPE